MIAIAPLEWPGMNQAFLTALVATLVLSFAIIPYGKRRPVGAPFSWGEAMLGSTSVSYTHLTLPTTLKSWWGGGGGGGG